MKKGGEKLTDLGESVAVAQAARHARLRRFGKWDAEDLPAQPPHAFVPVKGDEMPRLLVRQQTGDGPFRMQSRELIFACRRYGESDGIKCPRPTAFGGDVIVGEIRGVSLYNSADSGGVIGRGSPNHLHGVPAGKLNFRRFWLSHISTYEVLKPQYQGVD